MRVLLLVPAATLLLSSAAAQADVVEYKCAFQGTAETQNVKVNVELTVPTDAEVGEEMTIGWNGSYVDGFELRAPTTGLEGEINLYAYAGISDIDRLTSATGVAPIGTITPREPIPLPTTTVEMKTTPNNPGTGTVRAASINFGPRNNDPAIKCEVQNKSALTMYPLTIPGTGQSTSPSPEASDQESTSPQPTSTATTTRTPEGGAETGGGGEAGPDGRVLMGVGFLLILSSATGLLLRRRRRVPAL
ncbi:hypothetical protein [Nonomuraea sp. NPDC049784]|uniref:hypothetical protein n=1 Tax=Nonomuraea sp. NPDC049784 TaxID=3154361 RepID=UPI0033EC60F7